MILSRAKVLEAMRAGEITIATFDEKNLGLADYDLSLEMPASRVLEKGDFAVVQTIERIKLSPGIACFVFTRGSAARQGIDAVQSSIFCDPETDNQITLEVSNASPGSVELKHGMSIAKAVFIRVQ